VEKLRAKAVGLTPADRRESRKLIREMVQARHRAACGDPGQRERFEGLRNRVCAAHLRLVIAISKRYLPRRGHLDFEDLLQVGALGLMRACETFEPVRGFGFPTYSKNWVRQYIARAIANHARIIRTPVHVQDFQARCSRAAAKFVAATGRAASADDLASLTGMTPALVTRMLAENQEIETVGDALQSEVPTPLDALLAKERSEYARASLAALPDRECLVVERHTIDAEMSLAEIGATLAAERTGRVGLSRERVRQIEQRALVALRKRTDKDVRLAG
jgi:RNA polymerase primary sigma factor